MKLSNFQIVWVLVWDQFDLVEHPWVCMWRLDFWIEISADKMVVFLSGVINNTPPHLLTLHLSRHALFACLIHILVIKSVSMGRFNVHVYLVPLESPLLWVWELFWVFVHVGSHLGFFAVYLNGGHVSGLSKGFHSHFFISLKLHQIILVSLWPVY